MKVNGKAHIFGLLHIIWLVIFTRATLQQEYPTPGYSAYSPPAAGYGPSYQAPAYFPNPHRRRMYSSFAPPRRRILRVQEEFLGGEPAMPEYEDDGYVDPMPPMATPPASAGWQQRPYYEEEYAQPNPNMVYSGNASYGQPGYGPQMGPMNGMPNGRPRKMKGRYLNSPDGQQTPGQAGPITNGQNQQGSSNQKKQGSKSEQKTVRIPRRRRSELKLRKIQHNLIRWRHRVYHLQQNQEALSISSKLWKNLTVDLYRFRAQQKRVNRYNVRMTRHRKELNFRVNREYMYAASLNMEELLYKQQRTLFKAMREKTEKFNGMTLKNLGEYYDQKGNSASNWVSKELQDIFY